jgi:phospholipid/cholesterol/gamma-HCH transport system permease protein
MPDAHPTLTLQTTPDGVRAVLGGSWSAARLSDARSFAPLVQTLAQAAQQAPSSWDFSTLTRLDHTGAQLLWNSWGRRWPEQLDINPSQRTTLERVARLSSPEPAAKPGPSWAWLRQLGALAWHLLDHSRALLTLTGQLLIDSIRLLRAPRRGPWRDVSGHLYHIGSTAMPVTALVGFTIGIVLAYLMAIQLRQFGADTFIVNILGLALIRELGPMLAAILIAGRSGSSITAQIGVMRVTEELDAMRVMGIAKGFRLVLPRAIALSVAMPLLSVWTTLAALAGGMLAADTVLGITPAYFLTTLPRVVDISNLWLACGKSVVFGLLIALIACHFGLRVKPNTESLGQGTTASVVSAITTVLIVDAIIAVIFKSTGL